MSNQDKIIAGLDIGTNKVSLVVGRLDAYGSLEVLGMGQSHSDGIKEGTVTNITSTSEAIRRAHAEAERTSNINIKLVNVSISGKHIRSFPKHDGITQTSRGEIRLQDLNRLNHNVFRTVTEPGDEIIHVLPQLYTVDHETNLKNPVGMEGIKLEADFQVVTAQKNALSNVRKCVERAGMYIDEIILSPLASAHAVLSEEEKKAGVAVVDMGAGTTDVAIIKEGIVKHIAVIPLAGSTLTNDIREACNIMPEQAERFKQNFGSCMPQVFKDNELVSIPGHRNLSPKEVSLRQLAGVIEARAAEIIDFVYAEILSVVGDRKNLPAGVVLTGGMAQLRRFSELFEARTGLQTRIGYANEHMGASVESALKSPLQATSIGLVLAGLHTIDSRGVSFSVKEKVQSTSREDQTQLPTEEDGGFLGRFMKQTKNFLFDDYKE